MYYIKQLLTCLKWKLRGSPMKTTIGGWCGCCGKWIATAKLKFRDYHCVDNLFDLNTVCEAEGRTCNYERTSK
jgi:hypothetical protein